MSHAEDTRTDDTAGTAPIPAPAESCGDFGIRIARDGTWYHHDSPIARLPLVKLFASVLRREADGTYWLVTPAERGRILVEDVPFIAVSLTVSGTGRSQCLSFVTNLDDMVTAGENHPLRIDGDGNGIDRHEGEPRPYITIRPGLDARLARPVFYQLVDLGCEEQQDGTTRFGVWSDGKFFSLDQTLHNP
jgi:hypothetical protein